MAHPFFTTLSLLMKTEEHSQSGCQQRGRAVTSPLDIHGHLIALWLGGWGWELQLCVSLRCLCLMVLYICSLNGFIICLVCFFSWAGVRKWAWSLEHWETQCLLFVGATLSMRPAPIPIEEPEWRQTPPPVTATSGTFRLRRGSRFTWRKECLAVMER